jgi:hypothetical protein
MSPELPIGSSFVLVVESLACVWTAGLLVHNGVLKFSLCDPFHNHAAFPVAGSHPNGYVCFGSEASRTHSRSFR